MITRNLSSNLLYKAGLSSARGQVDQGFIQPSFEGSQGGKSYCLSQHCAPLLHCPHGKLFCLCVYPEFPLLCLFTVAFAVLCWRVWLHLLGNPLSGLAEKAVITVLCPLAIFLPVQPSHSHKTAGDTQGENSAESPSSNIMHTEITPAWEMQKASQRTGGKNPQILGSPRSGALLLSSLYSC